MAQLFVQTVPRHAGWLLVGPPAATSLVPQQDITVTFGDSSSVVVPAGVPAQLPGGGTTWDRTQQVVVGYVVKGSGALLACLESQLGGLSTDYAPLVRVLADAVQVYQPQQPGGAAIKSGAWSGGAFIGVGRAISGGGSYGIRDAQSMRGGGSVSGVPFYLTSKDNFMWCERVGFFLKVAALPASDTTLWDLDAGTSGYVRLKLTSAGRVVAEFSFNSGSGANTLNPTTAVATGNWYWVSCIYGPQIGADQVICMNGAVWGPGGATDGAQISYAGGLAAGNYQVLTTATLGWGTSQSSSYLGFPNSSGNEMSKLQGARDNSARGANVLGTWSPPGTDTSTSGLDYLYLCRQAVGSVSGTLTDSTSNAFHLTPGGAGLTVVADGPY